MPLQQLIRTISIASCLVITLNSFGQRDTVKYIKSPYRKEYTPHFELSTFKRGFASDSLKIVLDDLESKPRTTWSRNDSLEFAQISLKTGNIKLSKYYFDHLKIDLKHEEEAWFDQLMVYYVNEDYEAGLQKIIKDSPMILEYSKMYFFKKIFSAQVAQKEDPSWFETNIVFDWTLDTNLMKMDRKSPQFQQKVTEPLRNLEYDLKKIISYVHDDDPVLSSALREMGHIIDGYFNLTHTYIAYSIARHYNKKDKALMGDLAYVKARINQKKYKLPNFRKYFPRIEKWRFEYNVLKEKVILEQADTNKYVIPKTMKKKEEPLITFPHQLIVLGGIAFLIILLALILRPRNK